MRWHFLFVTLLTFSPAFAQDISPDTTQVKQLIALSESDQWKDLYRSLSYADQALKAALEINYPIGIALAHNMQGFCFWAFGDTELAIQSAHDALSVLGDEDNAAIKSERVVC